VPSFSTANYDLATIKQVVAQNAGKNNQYADLLSTPKPNTGTQYIEIYQATLNKVLQDFKAVESLGITYQPGVRQQHCSVLQNKIKDKSQPTAKALQAGLACCNTALTDHSPNGCGSTLLHTNAYRKLNANGRQDGGRFSATVFSRQRQVSQYNCATACMGLSKNEVNTGTQVMKSLTKSSAGTCINFMDGANGCVANAPANVAGADDCRSCAGIYNNVAPESFIKDLAPSTPFAPSTPALAKLLVRSQAEAQTPQEPPSGVQNSPGQALTEDNTAVCWSESSFSCPNGDTQAGFDQDVKNNNCKEVESTKIDKMCDDGPCDNDPESLVCRKAKANCEVDPDSGMKCMPGNENDPCIGCIKTADGANAITIAFIPLLLASFM